MDISNDLSITKQNRLIQAEKTKQKQKQTKKKPLPLHLFR